MNINIYCKTKKLNKFYKSAIEEFEKRLSRYCKIKLIILKNDNALLKLKNDNIYQICITTGKKTLASEELAKKIENLGIAGISNIAIFINQDFECDEKFSISQMVLSDDLLTTIIFEQIYRSFRIINNQSYHK